MLRRDTTKLGRVSEMLDKEKELKNSRRAFDTDEGAVAKNEADPTAEGGGKAVKAKSDAGRSRKGGDGGEDEGERKKKKRKKNKETGDEGRSVRSG
jgi:transcription initiation factor TFIID subunit 13